MKIWLLGGLLALLFLAVPQYIARDRNLPPEQQITAGKEVNRQVQSSTVVKTKAEIPQTLIIPKIGVKAEIEQVGLDSQKRMDVPSSWKTVGWYKFGPKPGEMGNSVVDGHLDSSDGSPAVFFKLNHLQIGDLIEIIDQSGQLLKFNITKIESYKYDRVPIEEIFGENNQRRLNLITCEGIWDKVNQNYSNRLVVFSVLKE